MNHFIGLKGWLNGQGNLKRSEADPAKHRGNACGDDGMDMSSFYISNSVRESLFSDLIYIPLFLSLRLKDGTATTYPLNETV